MLRVDAKSVLQKEKAPASFPVRAPLVSLLSLAGDVA
jgi:hypothetical protein